MNPSKLALDHCITTAFLESYLSIPRCLSLVGKLFEDFEDIGFLGIEF